MNSEQDPNEIAASENSDKIRRVDMLRELLSRYSEELPLSETQHDEIERKLTAYHNRPTQQEPWAEVKARIRSKS